MQTEYIQFFKGKVFIGEDFEFSKDDRQIVMPVVSLGHLQAPKKSDGNHYIDLRIYLSDEGTKWAGKRDVVWLLPGNPECALVDIQVLCAFKPGTFDPSLFGEMPEELQEKVAAMNAEASI